MANHGVETRTTRLFLVVQPRMHLQNDLQRRETQRDNHQGGRSRRNSGLSPEGMKVRRGIRPLAGVTPSTNPFLRGTAVQRPGSQLFLRSGMVTLHLHRAPHQKDVLETQLTHPHHQRDEKAFQITYRLHQREETQDQIMGMHHFRLKDATQCPVICHHPQRRVMPPHLSRP